MKRKNLFLPFAVVAIISILIYFKSNVLNKNVPFIPIDYNNVDKVLINGFANKISNDVNAKTIVESINEVKKYEQKYNSVNHSTPAPNWNITIIMKDRKSVVVYEDYDGKTKISDWHKSYIINEIMAQRILSKNNLQKQIQKSDG